MHLQVYEISHNGCYSPRYFPRSSLERAQSNLVDMDGTAAKCGSVFVATLVPMLDAAYDADSL